MISVYERIMTQRPLTKHEEDRFVHLIYREKKSKYAAKYRASHPEVVQASRERSKLSREAREAKRKRDIRYRQTPRAKELSRKSSAAFKDKHPEKTAADLKRRKERRVLIKQKEQGLFKVSDKLAFWRQQQETRTLEDYEGFRLKQLIRLSSEEKKEKDKAACKSYRQRKGPEWMAEQARKAREWRAANPEAQAAKNAARREQERLKREAKNGNQTTA
jgi:hypothetical protein